MGQIADALRANLREIALSDARSLRALDEELTAARQQIAPAVAGSTPPSMASLSDGLETFSRKELYERCKQRGLKGLSKAKRSDLITALRGQGFPPSSATRPSSPQASEDLPALRRLEHRLERLEVMIQAIAAHLGVDPESFR